MRLLLLLLVGWLPVWAGVWLFARPRRAAPTLLGAAVVGLVGGMACVELRRHGALASVPGTASLPLLGIQLADVLRFAMVGGSASFVFDGVLRRLEESGPPSGTSPPDRAGDRLPPGPPADRSDAE
jgi:hypothetical protein